MSEKLQSFCFLGVNGSLHNKELNLGCAPLDTLLSGTLTHPRLAKTKSEVHTIKLKKSSFGLGTGGKSLKFKNLWSSWNKDKDRRFLLVKKLNLDPDDTGLHFVWWWNRRYWLALCMMMKLVLSPGPSSTWVQNLLSGPTLHWAC
jgi:hypothetical protein